VGPRASRHESLVDPWVSVPLAIALAPVRIASALAPVRIASASTTVRIASARTTVRVSSARTTVRVSTVGVSAVRGQVSAKRVGGPLLALLAMLPLVVLPAWAQSSSSAPALGANVQGDLRVPYVAYSRFEGGPPLSNPVAFEPGDQVAMRARLAGFRMAEVEFQRYRVMISYEVAAFDFRGIPIGEPRKDVLNEPVETEDKDWLPMLEHNFFLPPMAEFGDYEIRLKVRDEVSQRQQAFTFQFRVNGKKLPDLAGLTILNFGYYRRSDDASPLPEAVYRSGNTLWAKFDLAGFRVSERNRYHVACDVEVRDSEGKVLFQQPDALQEQAAPDYPRRYVPGLFSLQIQPNTRKGDYRIAVIARDLLAETSTEAEFPFTIE
jgi:hypothetical protein